MVNLSETVSDVRENPFVLPSSLEIRSDPAP